MEPWELSPERIAEVVFFKQKPPFDGLAPYRAVATEAVKKLARWLGEHCKDKAHLRGDIPFPRFICDECMAPFWEWAEEN